MRYTFYREHKYISFRCNELERLIAKTDFRQADELQHVAEAFEQLMQLLEAHAEYENNSLHVLLQRKHSTVYKTIEQDHLQLDEQIASLRNLLHTIANAQTEDDIIKAGYRFYLWFRKFNADNLIHLHEEETIILPELQRLYSDEELRSVDAAIYAIMSVEELIQMVEELFPHMNINDWQAFLMDIQHAVPEKFVDVWHAIKVNMSHNQQEYFIQKLSII